MAYARKFLANYSILVFGDLVARFVALFAMIHIARILGKDLFGLLGFATALSAYFELVARQGLDTYGIQEVARQPAHAKRLADTLFGLRLTTSICAFFALSITALCLSKPHDLKLLIVLSGLMFFTAAFSPQWVFQATEEMKYAAVARIVASLIFAALVLSVLNGPRRLIYVPVIQFSGEAIAVAWLWLEFRKRYGLLRPAFDFKAWRKILRQSAPIAMEGAFGVVLFNFDMVMLGFWKPASEVGEYSAAYKFINFSSAFVFLYATNLLPLISRARGNPSGLRQVSDKSLQYTLLISMPLAAGGAVLAQDLIRSVFGTQFSAAAAGLQILIWILPLVTCRVVFRNTLLSHGFQRDLLWCTFVAAALNAGLNLLLIPRYTYLGSAVAMVISESLLLLLLHHQVGRKVVRLPLALHFWKPAVACVPMVALISWYREGPLLARICLGVLVYTAGAWIVRAFSMRDLRLHLGSSANCSKK